MAVVLPPPTGDAKNPPDNVTVWGRLFGWLFLLWNWVTSTIPGRLTFGGDAGSYSAALFASAGQSDIGGLDYIGPTIAVFAGQTQTAQSISNSTETVLTNWAEQLDTANAFNAATGIFTAPRGGVYMASGTVSYAAAVWNTTGASGIIRKNGTNVADCFLRTSNATVSNNLQTPTVVWTGRLVVGDTLAFATFQFSGGAVNTEGAHTNFTINWIGP